MKEENVYANLCGSVPLKLPIFGRSIFLMMQFWNGTVYGVICRCGSMLETLYSSVCVTIRTWKLTSSWNTIQTKHATWRHTESCQRMVRCF